RVGGGTAEPGKAVPGGATEEKEGGGGPERALAAARIAEWRGYGHDAGAITAGEYSVRASAARVLRCPVHVRAPCPPGVPAPSPRRLRRRRLALRPRARPLRGVEHGDP